MKHILTTLFALLLCNLTAGAAEYKVTERSDRKPPEWLYRLPKGRILVEVESPSLGQAQTDADTELKRRIVSAVATNITSATTHLSEETRTDDSHRYLERFSADTRTNAASLPFLSGVSLSKAEGTYWEKREDNKTKQTCIVYSVLYPLSDAQLAKMTEEFEQTDRAKSNQLAALREGIHAIDSSDGIEEALGYLQALQSYFFDPVRLAETQALAKSYSQLYKGLTLSGDCSGGVLVCEVKLNGRPFKVTARPDLKSNCASGLRAEHSDDGYSLLIHYNDEDCLADEQNWIDVTLRIKNARLHDRFLF